MKRKINYNPIILLTIVIIGLILRLKQWNNYLIYPDSYLYLNTYKNALSCGKPLYCALSNFISTISSDPAFWLRNLNLFLSVLLIPVVYSFFESRYKNGLIAAFLLSLSFTIISWTNLVLPDIIALFFLVLYLWSKPSSARPLYLFLAGLTRPEYIILLPISLLTLVQRKFEKFISISFFIVLLVYYFSIRGTVLPDELLFILREPVIIRNLFKYDVLIIILAIPGIWLFYKKRDEYGNFLFTQLAVFLIIYTWHNSLNWRYGLHLIIPLIYFASSSLKMLTEKLKEGRKRFDYIAIFIGVLAIFQIYISSLGVKKNIPDTNYELYLIRRSYEIARSLGLKPVRIGTFFDKAVHYSVGVSGYNPLYQPAQKNDLLIIDNALASKGYKNNESSSKLACFKTNNYYNLGEKSYYSEEVCLYIIK